MSISGSRITPANRGIAPMGAEYSVMARNTQSTQPETAPTNPDPVNPDPANVDAQPDQTPIVSETPILDALDAQPDAAPLTVDTNPGGIGSDAAQESASAAHAPGPLTEDGPDGTGAARVDAIMVAGQPIVPGAHDWTADDTAAVEKAIADRWTITYLSGHVLGEALYILNETAGGATYRAAIALFPEDTRELAAREKKLAYNRRYTAATRKNAPRPPAGAASANRTQPANTGRTIKMLETAALETAATVDNARAFLTAILDGCEVGPGAPLPVDVNADTARALVDALTVAHNRLLVGVNPERVNLTRYQDELRDAELLAADAAVEAAVSGAALIRARIANGPGSAEWTAANDAHGVATRRQIAADAEVKTLRAAIARATR